MVALEIAKTARTTNTAKPRRGANFPACDSTYRYQASYKLMGIYICYFR